MAYKVLVLNLKNLIRWINVGKGQKREQKDLSNRTVAELIKREMGPTVFKTINFTFVRKHYTYS